MDFWASQTEYIKSVFLPVVIGAAVFSPLLVGLFVFGFLRRYRLWRLGAPEKPAGSWLTRLGGTLAVVFAHARIVRGSRLYPGVMHMLLFWGTALLVAGKVARLFSFGGITTPPPTIFLAASLVSEIGGLLIIIGGSMAVFRRYIRKPACLDTTSDDSLVFVWALIIILTGFLAKGYRIATSEVMPADWLSWAPVSYWFSRLFAVFQAGDYRNHILVWHRVMFHVVPAAALLGYAWLMRSRLQHLVFAPLNVLLRPLSPGGTLKPIDLETAESFGAAKIEDFTGKQLLDLDACTRCGRCQDVCPAQSSGKELDPKKVIQDLKAHLNSVYPTPLVRRAAAQRADMISEVAGEPAIWDCTTCRACDDICPVYVGHIDKLVDMRRNLVMERSNFPESAGEALKSLGTRGHPWRGTTAARTDWASGLDIKTAAGDSSFDILYWVGCTGALEERNMRVSAATARLMQMAGVDFAVLGTGESCCGDPARRLGDEYLFQTLCQKNIETFRELGVRRIVTACPHCFNMLRNEYPQFGGRFEVMHHSQLLAALVRDGRLRPGGLPGRVAYHDSCYLGRYNNVYQAPRDIIRSIPGVRFLELPRNRQDSFCCGGGGGHMWLEEEPAKRLNARRARQVVAAGVDTLATACPFCLSMLEDGLKSQGEEQSTVLDVSELLLQALTTTPTPATS